MVVFNFIRQSVSKVFSFDRITENAVGYAETRIELLKLEVDKKLQDLTQKFIAAAIIGFMFLLMVIFVSLGIIHLINYLTESNHIGYWSIAVLYIILFSLLIYFKDSTFFNNFIRKLANYKTNDNNKRNSHIGR